MELSFTKQEEILMSLTQTAYVTLMVVLALLPQLIDLYANTPDSPETV